jgi:hypothetical protein
MRKLAYRALLDLTDTHVLAKVMQRVRSTVSANEESNRRMATADKTSTESIVHTCNKGGALIPSTKRYPPPVAPDEHPLEAAR